MPSQANKTKAKHSTVSRAWQAKASKKYVPIEVGDGTAEAGQFDLSIHLSLNIVPLNPHTQRSLASQLASS